MRLLDWSSQHPEENLALDEVLLDAVEEGAAPGALRLWESPTYFVVLGVAQQLDLEARAEACIEDGVPILRRCSAGGAVLQGPGCLNFTIACRYETHPDLRGVRSSYCHILQTLAGAFREHGAAMRLDGTSDLTLDGRKVSGNAQKRRRNAMLHHGTLVYALDTERVARYLAEPKDRPAYRGSRAHGEFMTQLPLGPDALREIVGKAFHADSPAFAPSAEELAAAQALARSKYATPEWTRRR